MVSFAVALHLLQRPTLHLMPLSQHNPLLMSHLNQHSTAQHSMEQSTPSAPE